jgi:hypothetical protein
LPDNLVINTRQIAQYPARTLVDPSDLILVQVGGLGGAYAAATANSILTTPGLNPGGPFVWGVAPPPADASPDQILTGDLVLPSGHAVLFNAYVDASGSARYWQNGAAGGLAMEADGTLGLGASVSGAAGALVPAFMNSLLLSPAGHLTLLDTLTVARDPTAPLEVATMGYVTNHTVASFNARSGAVTLALADITGAGGAPVASPAFTGVPTAPTAALNTSTTQVATTAFVVAEINSISPDVHSFNGRSGIVTFLTADFNAATAVAGPATVPTPLLTDNNTTIVNTAWVNSWAAANTVASFNTRTGAVVLTAADITAAGGAILASPIFSGSPTAPTANPGTSTGQLATTAFVQAAIAASTTGVSSWNTRTGAVVLTQADIVAANGWASPSFTGVPLAPTATTPTNNTQIATTAFVHAAITASAPGVTTFNTRSGAVVLTLTDVTGAGGAPAANPTFTGTPTAPTAAPGNATTQLATTAFVAAAVAAVTAGVASFNGRIGAVTLIANDLSAAGGALTTSPAFTGTPTAPTATTGTSNQQIASTQFVAEAIAAGVSGVASFNTRTGAVVLTTADIIGAAGAPIASPVFTGVPAGPTAPAATSTTQLATTAFVTAAIAAAVVSFNGRTGAVTLIANDVSAAGGALLAGPTFTGVPAAPTAVAGTNTTQLATTAFVTAAIAAFGGGVYLPLAGGTLTGNLTINPPAASASGLTLNSILGASTYAEVFFQTSGLKRWGFLCYPAGETGANAGSDLYFQNYNDAGAVIGNPVTVTRATGAVSFSGPVTHSSTITAAGQINSTGAAPVLSTAGFQSGASAGSALGGTFGSYGVYLAGPNNTGFNWAVMAINAGTIVGTIYCTATATAFNTTSDVRLKDAIEPFTGGRILLDALAVKNFRWKADGSSGIGLLAQEARDIYPVAVSDAQGEPGDEPFIPASIDYSKYVPILIEALQDAHRRIDELELVVKTLH